ncbi:glycosyltransferase family 9 protein [Psychromonas sp. 14N.309.X.WAT.B.A12]|uniref:glycosyltransferase family 9 protein n=1 Tax=Psychromonas sp. 14N.309.X.WAT.B.A12 TaxID=2998322 RepID=UPI0025B26ADB|nr:glycosyltransferase family 9 protein [Psychromonas sp. 14N.309.X.WAT.B.A12]MDN2664645.1 glycosyltransferase family 9 protein [Psychromonas sp. 14N.309.X.WAT.B.A12]
MKLLGTPFMPPLFTSAPKSICLLRLSAIGDVCHAVAMVQAIQKQWPSTKITWIMGKIEAQLLNDLPNVEVIIFDKKTGFKGMRAIWKQLSGRKFDALLHMQLALRASALTIGIKAKYKIGFNRKRAKEGQWLFTNKKIPDTASQHVLESFFEFAYFLGIDKTIPTWNIPLSKSDISFAQSISSANKPLFVISPAASKDERNWLTDRYAAIADYAIEKGFEVVLCGSPAPREITLGNNIQNLMQQSAINLIGKTSLKQLTATLKQAQIVLAPDSGPAHIATTQGTTVIGLYGHSNPQRTGPYLSQDNVVSVYKKHVQLQYNKSISELPWSARTKGEHIMKDISLEQVINVIDHLD